MPPKSLRSAMTSRGSMPMAVCSQAWMEPMKCTKSSSRRRRQLSGMTYHRPSVSKICGGASSGTMVSRRLSRVLRFS